MSRTTHPTTKCNIPEDRNPQQHHCENLKPHSSSYVRYKVHRAVTMKAAILWDVTLWYNELS